MFNCVIVFDNAFFRLLTVLIVMTSDTVTITANKPITLINATDRCFSRFSATINIKTKTSKNNRPIAVMMLDMIIVVSSLAIVPKSLLSAFACALSEFITDINEDEMARGKDETRFSRAVICSCNAIIF